MNNRPFMSIFEMNLDALKVAPMSILEIANILNQADGGEIVIELRWAILIAEQLRIAPQ